MTELTLVRRAFGDRHTEGDLYWGDVREWCTLEDAVRAPGVKVPGQTAIPFGRYRLTIHDSPKFGRKLVMLQGVRDFSYVLIHAGNETSDTEGCILVGYSQTTTTDGWIGDSRRAEMDLTARVHAAYMRGGTWINVIGPTLRIGMGGRNADHNTFMAVRVLQRWLRMPEQYRTGFYGERTESYVTQVQHKFGVRVDGVTGRDTWTKVGVSWAA